MQASAQRNKFLKINCLSLVLALAISQIGQSTPAFSQQCDLSPFTSQRVGHSAIDIEGSDSKLNLRIYNDYQFHLPQEKIVEINVRTTAHLEDLKNHIKSMVESRIPKSACNDEWSHGGYSTTADGSGNLIIKFTIKLRKFNCSSFHYPCITNFNFEWCEASQKIELLSNTFDVSIEIFPRTSSEGEIEFDKNVSYTGGPIFDFLKGRIESIGNSLQLPLDDILLGGLDKIGDFHISSVSTKEFSFDSPIQFKRDIEKDGDVKFVSLESGNVGLTIIHRALTKKGSACLLQEIERNYLQYYMCYMIDKESHYTQEMTELQACVSAFNAGENSSGLRCFNKAMEQREARRKSEITIPKGFEPSKSAKMTDAAKAHDFAMSFLTQAKENYAAVMRAKNELGCAKLIK